jgi:hypothetical protein
MMVVGALAASSLTTSRVTQGTVSTIDLSHL